MTKYEWSEEARRGLTFGSTVEGRVVRDATDIVRIRFDGDDEYRYLNLHDPSTLRPPSIEWIRELARERLGRDAHVEEQAWNCAVAEETVVVVLWKPGKAGLRGHQLAVHDERGGMDRFRAAVAAIVALANAGIGK